ncbi:hypothetical protein BZA70DRAFT_275109 [Myxozyma melibiosi]|uniref:Uncharacterized protein n=1 Tax=Myxozyma melibiosi TaxID=54550 RepID=A0ABR1FAE0_9ASCO
MPLPTASAEAEMHLSSSIPPSTAHLHTTSPPLLQHQRSMDTFLMSSAPSSTRPTNRRQQHQQRLQRARSQPSLIRASSSAAHLPSFVNAPLPMDFATLSQQQFMIQPTHQPVQQVGLGLSLADAPLIPGQVPQHRAAMVSPPPVSSPSSLPSPSSLSATKKKRSESGRANAAASGAGGVTFNNLTPKDHVKIMSSVAKSGSNKSKKPTNKKK